MEFGEIAHAQAVIELIRAKVQVHEVEYNALSDVGDACMRVRVASRVVSASAHD